MPLVTSTTALNGIVPPVNGLPFTSTVPVLVAVGGGIVVPPGVVVVVAAAAAAAAATAPPAVTSPASCSGGCSTG